VVAVAVLFFGSPTPQLAAIAGVAALLLALLALAQRLLMLPTRYLLVLACACLALQRSPQAPALRFVESRPVILQARLLEWHPQEQGAWALFDRLQEAGHPTPSLCSMAPPSPLAQATAQAPALAPAEVRLLGVASGHQGRPPAGAKLLLEGQLRHDGHRFHLERFRWELLEYGRAPPITMLRNRVRERLQACLSAETAGLALALLLGERRDLPENMQDDYRRFGLIHLLAVSGLHFWLWDQLLRRLLRGPLAIARWPLLLLAAALADGATPVVRACSVVLLRDASAAMAMPVRGLHLWAAAWAVEVAVLQPRVDGLGFALSYTATAFLILGATQVHGSWWRKTLTASWVAFLGSMPILHAAQATIEPWTILLSPFLAMLLPIRLFASLLALLPGCALAMDSLLRGVASLESMLFHALDRVPLSPWSTPQMSSLGLALSAGLGLWTCRHWQRLSCRYRLLTLLLMWAGFAVPMPSHPGIVALPTGHGLAVIIHGQHRSLSFDLGSGDVHPERLFERSFMPQLGRRHWPLPELFVRSHGDFDHVNALPYLLQRADVEEIRVAPEQRRTLSGFDPFLIEVIGCRGARNDVSNDGGHVLEVKTEHGFRMVLLGDQSGYSLRQLRNRIAPGPIDILLVPHHGLTTDGLAELLIHLRPRLAWTSSGPRNYPLPVAPLLDYFGVPLVSTLDHGLEWRMQDLR
jgi:competence protein ComEC